MLAGFAWLSSVARVLAVLSVMGAMPGMAHARDERPLQTFAGYPPPESAIDASAQFNALWVDGRLDADAVDRSFNTIRDALRGWRIIIVPSYLVDVIRPAVSIGLIDYFSEQKRWLDSLGVDNVIAPIVTQSTVATNAGVIVDLITDSNKPVCILSHSKGGLDALRALTSLSAEQLSRVRCWIALQVPFAGSPIADAAVESWYFRSIAHAALFALGGAMQSLIDLTTPVRQHQLRLADAAIRRVVNQVPTLAVTAVLHPPPSLWSRSIYEPARSLMAADGIDSDGMVPTGSAILPHARYVVLDGLDHGDTADLDCGTGCPLISNVLLLKALLAITLEAHKAYR